MITMPVYQIYFPDEISSELQRIADEDGINVKEFIQKVVGTNLAERRKRASAKK
jgi:hypothetical protein